MLAAQSPFSGDRPIRVPKSHRIPLQPRNQSAAMINLGQPKPCTEISVLDISNKENVPPSYSYSYSSTPVIECFQAETTDPSSADELNAAREKLVRLKMEEERNEEELRQRGMLMDMEMKEILNRGEMQKELELEVDRLYRLMEIKSACTMISRVRSLRDKEREKKIKLDQLNKSYLYIQGRKSVTSESEAA